MKTYLELEEKVQEEKSRIFKIAYKMFLKDNNLGIREVAEEAKVHVPTIYRFFNSKQGLLLEIYKHMSVLIAENLQAKMSSHTHAFCKLTQYGVNYLNLAINHPELFEHLINFYAHKIEEGTKEYEFIQNTLTIQSINLLKDILMELYVQNRTIYEYKSDSPSNKSKNSQSSNDSIDDLSVLAWSYIHGLATLCNNAKWMQENLFSDFANHVKESFVIISKSIVKSSFFEAEGEVMLEAMEILNTISL